MTRPIRVFVPFTTTYVWALRPFAVLFNEFWSPFQPVVLAGANHPGFALPRNFIFLKTDRVNRPANQWSNSMMHLLDSIPDEHIILMLEDYWMIQPVDLDCIAAMHQYAVEHPEVLRIDLTTDRLYAGGMFDVEKYGPYDVIETPPGTPYQISLQAGIWSHAQLRTYLTPDKSPWELELYNPPPDHMRVLGTRQCPVRYANAIHAGSADWKEIERVPDPQSSMIRRMLPKR